MIYLAADKYSAGPWIDSLTTASKFIGISSAFLVIGLLLAMGFLLLEVSGSLTETTLKLRPALVISASAWFVASLLSIVATIANILGTSLGNALEFNTIRSFVTQITLGQYMLFESCVALLIALFAIRIKSSGAAIFLLLISIIGLIAPVFQSHSSTSGSHALAIGSLIIHVIALSLWVGGLIAIALLDEDQRAIALPRFSQLALWAAIATVISGTANGWTRLNYAAAWDSSYARIIIVKVLLTSGLILIGYKNRKLLSNLSSINLKSLGKLIIVEVIIMISATLLGSWLNTHQAPTARDNAKFNAALAVTGSADPGAPTLSKLLFKYDPDAFFIGALIVAVALYVKGVLILTRRGDKWPVGRTIAFALGISAIDYATSGGLGLYAKYSFEYHMIAHMVLGMIAPIFIVLGAPITLALRTLPQGRTAEERGLRGTLVALLHSKPAVFLTNPVVILALFDGSLFALYLTSLFGGMMQSHTGHLFMNLHFILAGILFFHVIIGIDPNPKKFPHIVRIVILFAAMAIHAFFSISLMSSTTLIDQGYYQSIESQWLGDILTVQQRGGSIGWAMGEIPILIALVATFIQWMRDDKKETTRIDKNEARLAAMGEPDDLARYNNYLTELHKKDQTGG